MFEDLDFINNYPYIYEWLKIPLGKNPFLIPPEVLSEVNPYFIFIVEKQSTKLIQFLYYL